MAAEAPAASSCTVCGGSNWERWCVAVITGLFQSLPRAKPFLQISYSLKSKMRKHIGVTRWSTETVTFVGSVYFVHIRSFWTWGKGWERKESTYYLSDLSAKKLNKIRSTWAVKENRINCCDSFTESIKLRQFQTDAFRLNVTGCVG